MNFKRGSDWEHSRPSSNQQKYQTQEKKKRYQTGERKPETRQSWPRVALAGCMLMMVAAFMPFMGVIIEGHFYHFAIYNRKIAMAFIAAVFVLLCLKKRKLAFVPLLIAIAKEILEMVFMLNNPFLPGWFPNIGFYLYIIGAIVTSVGIVKTMKNPSAGKDDF